MLHKLIELAGYLADSSLKIVLAGNADGAQHSRRLKTFCLN